MRKRRYSAGMKIAVVAVAEAFAVVFALCVAMLVALSRKDILDFGGMQGQSFETSGYFASMFRETVSEILEFTDLRRKFETNGAYDDGKAIGIYGYYNDWETGAQGMGAEGDLRYSLGDLAEWSRDFTRTEVRFESEYDLSQGICQRQRVYRDGEFVLSEEKSISSLDEMTLELQDYIIENVEHYYGGAYTPPLQGLLESRDAYEDASAWGWDASRAEAAGKSQEPESAEPEEALETASSVAQGQKPESAEPEEALETASFAAQGQGPESIETSKTEKTMETASSAAQGQESESIETSETEQEKLDGIVSRVIAGELYELKEDELELLLRDMGLENTLASFSCEAVNEEYLPIDGEGIWNSFLAGNCTMGQMCRAYRALGDTLENIGQEINQYKRCLNRYHPAGRKTNVSYWVSRGNEKAVYTNMETPLKTGLAEYGEKAGKYVYYGENDVRLGTNVTGMEEEFYDRIEPKYGRRGNVIFVSVDTSFPHADIFTDAEAEYDRLYPWIYVCLPGAAVSALACLIGFIYLSMAAGKGYDGDEVRLNSFDRMPAEILFVLSAAAGLLFALLFGQVFYGYEGEGLWKALAASGVYAFFGMAFLLLFCLSFVRRIRAGALWGRSIANWIRKGVARSVSGRKPSVKLVLFYLLHLAACLAIFWLMASGMGDFLFLLDYAEAEAAFYLGIFLFLLLCGAELWLIVREGVQRNKVLEGIRKISDGDLEYKIDTEALKGDNRRLAEAANAVGDGLYHAVDASMKNERLQTDLITNVSHDIKTPLTSIINYVDLLKREDLQNERARNYIDVLDGKSQRLKQLTEDLVEASKVSSGNITLNMERIDLVELVHQTVGEFDEKFEARGLTAIAKLPKGPVFIRADGRRIWRVLENLYNNVAKYAMGNTRVYMNLEADGRNVEFSIKNISESPLNIQADELTERFIRGDVSRSTEGSGLGLSIARNLTALMGGEFEIYLDGDLFKATIRFPQEEA